MSTKLYSDYLDEISDDELYEGLLGHGLFTDKLPPLFTSETFYQFCISNTTLFNDKAENGYIFFESIRNTNTPRALGVPNPMKYEILCKTLRENWNDIRKILKSNVSDQSHKISRIHLRKIKGEKYLFEMNYKNWETDDSPMQDLLIGKHYQVKTDISTCFPSIYTHSICWALIGKDTAKNDRDKKKWYNKIDTACQKMRNGETHGLMIGPHASNLLSEIILTSVDKNLSNKGYEYIRNIDDYICVTKTYEEAQRFLTDLSTELRVYDLSINHKKTSIASLPTAAVDDWVRILGNTTTIGRYGIVDYKSAQAYLDTAIKLMEDNGNNASALNYAIKVISKGKISQNGKKYCAKTIMHLAILYPYLVPLLEKHLFIPLSVEKAEIEKFSQLLYDESIKNGNHEGAYFALYYAIKYSFQLHISVVDIIEKDSCILKTIALIYCKNNNMINDIDLLKNEAKRLKTNYMDENWLFVYETLQESDFAGSEWEQLKRNNISFIRDDSQKQKEAHLV